MKAVRPSVLAGSWYPAAPDALAAEVEGHAERREVALVGFAHRRDQLLRLASLLARPDHDRGAVGVVGADVDAPLARELLEPHPDIRLQVFDQVADVDTAICIRQRAGNKNVACFIGHFSINMVG